MNSSEFSPKGNQVKNPELMKGNSGNTMTTGDALGRSKKSSLFFLTSFSTLESSHSAIGLKKRKGLSLSERFRALPRVLEKPV